MGSKILLILMLSASAFDVGTTEYGLSRGVDELNPLTHNRAVRVTLNVAVPVAIWKATQNMTDRDRLYVCIGYVGTKTAFGVYNLSRAANPTYNNSPVTITSPHLQKNFFSLEDSHARVFLKSNER